jgi:hypothetical protein
MRRDPRTISQIERCETPVRLPDCARGYEMSGLDRELVVVQFPHPGREHDPGDATVMLWNTKDHGRKFLRSTGRYLDAHGALGFRNCNALGRVGSAVPRRRSIP